MKNFPDNHINCVLTDPPYGLKFMNEAWDHGIPGTEYWKELLRICKPGTMGLFFGGARTYHRLTCALEDAGWEIRDCLMWVYSQGFPKSHNKFGLEGYGTALKPAHEIVICAQKPLSINMEQDIIVENLIKLWCQLCLMLPVNVAEKIFMSNNLDMNAALDFARMTANQKSSIQEDLCVLMDMSQLEKVLISCLSIVSLWKNTLEGLWKDGNMCTIKTKINQTIDLKTLSYYLSQLTPLAIIQEETKQLGSWLNVLPAPRYLNAIEKNINAIQELSALENVISKDGLNLCPNYEPIILAMKPLDGTYSQNVKKWGNGGINIEECRINVSIDDPNHRITSRGNEGCNSMFGMGGHNGNLSNKGRWPANIIFDEETALMLDEQSGTLKSGKIRGNISTKSKNEIYGKSKNSNVNEFDSNSGGASRFFYCAKASSNERNKGLDCYLTVKYTPCIIGGSLCQEENIAAVQLLKKVISDSALTNLSIEEYGENITVQCHKDSLFTIKTKIKQIIESKTLNLSTLLPTNEFIQDVALFLENGGNHVVNVELRKVFQILITNGEMVSALGVSNAVLKMLQSISEEENWKKERSSHPTVKPLKLLEYLLKLIAPPSPLIIDPFLGSGSTLLAAKNLDMNAIGIEKVEEYCYIAKNRLLN